jgi:hypothetical protein
MSPPKLGVVAPPTPAPTGPSAKVTSPPILTWLSMIFCSPPSVRMMSISSCISAPIWKPIEPPPMP